MNYIIDHGITSVLEIGTANGFSGICIWEALKTCDGVLVTLDLSRHAFEESTINFTHYDDILGGKASADCEPAVVGKKFSCGHNELKKRNIISYFWDALEIMPQIQTWNTITTQTIKSEFVYEGPEAFDLIFIDGRFVRTLPFYLESIKLLNKWWHIIIDDVIKYRYKMEDFYEYLEKNDLKYEVKQLDSDDGVMVLRGAGKG